MADGTEPTERKLSIAEERREFDRREWHGWMCEIEEHLKAAIVVLADLEQTSRPCGGTGGALMARHRRGVVLFTAAVALTLLATACGGGDQTVEVTLLEWGIGLTDRSANAGEVTFDATNDGPNDVHEFVILRTDLAATELPTDETGAVDEVGEGIEVIDEIEDITPAGCSTGARGRWRCAGPPPACSPPRPSSAG